jgi:hypothetical protein
MKFVIPRIKDGAVQFFELPSDFVPVGLQLWRKAERGCEIDG